MKNPLRKKPHTLDTTDVAVTPDEDSPNLRTSLETSPMGAHILNYLYKAKEDIQDSSNPITPVLWAAGAVATQTTDRLRLVMIYSAPLAIEIMDRTDNKLYSSSIAGLGVAALFGVSNGATGKTLAETLGRLPKTREEFASQHPKMVTLFTDALPVVSHDRSDKSQSTLRSKIRRQRKLARTALLIGSTAPVAVSSVNNATTPELNKINREVTLAGMAGSWALVAAAGESIRQLALHGQYQTAENIKGVLGNEKWWLVAAGATVGVDLIQSKLALKKASRLYTVDDTELATD